MICLGVALALAVFHPGPTYAKKIVWKLQSTWPAADFHQNDVKGFAEKVNAMSGGRLQIDVLPAGAIVPPFETLDAAHKGIIDAGNAWPGYWYGKNTAATLFGSIPGGPFGMNNEDFLGWIYLGGGLDLYNQLLQDKMKMNVVAFPIYGETPEPQGWFDKPIKSVADFKGLKFRAAGMSGEVFKAMGMSVVTIAGGEIVPALERGVIDAAEYSDPSSDMSMGFQDVKKFYHLPGIHQPTGMMEVLINKKKWDELTDDLKKIVEIAAMAQAMEFNLMMADQNSKDLKKLVEEHKVTIVETPRDLMMEVLKGWDVVAEKEAKKNPFFAEVYESQRKWAERIVPYRRVAHPPYDLAAEYYWGEKNPYKIMKATK
jgi:TRAP-type mannitol/chloroaromatic compound transport system substrate-binding protein